MKLLLCYDCYDVKKLSRAWRTCSCGRVRARYADSINAHWNGRGELLGIANSSLASALQQHRDLPRSDKLGHEFVAFVIPRDAPTVRIVKK